MYWFSIPILKTTYVLTKDRVEAKANSAYIEAILLRAAGEPDANHVWHEVLAYDAVLTHGIEQWPPGLCDDHSWDAQEGCCK